MCLAQGPECSEPGEARTRGPFSLESSTLPLSHYAPRFLNFNIMNKCTDGGTLSDILKQSVPSALKMMLILTCVWFFLCMHKVVAVLIDLDLSNA